MDFYVIYQNPEFNVRVNDVETIDKVTYEKEDPFMIVAAYKVNEGEIYQAVKAGPHRVLLNRKSFTDMHQYVENVDTLAEAFEAIAGGEEQTQPKYWTVTFQSDKGTAPAAIQVEQGKSIAVSALPTMSAINIEDDEFTYEYVFNGWTLNNDYVTDPLAPAANITLVADWTENKTAKPVDPEPQEP